MYNKLIMQMEVYCFDEGGRCCNCTLGIFAMYLQDISMRRLEKFCTTEILVKGIVARSLTVATVEDI